jgi:hypothetical protein
MGAAAILAVIEAIGKVVNAIKGIYDFIKFADDLINGRSEWDQARLIISSQIVNRNQILQVSAEILDAIAQLDRRIFLERISDKLGNTDQAMLALDTWKRNGNANQSAIALNESVGALSDLLRYSTNSVYPNESLVFPLIEILFMRLIVLKEADPDFVRSPISRRPILDAVQLLDSTADNIESSIHNANAIRDASEVTTRVSIRPPSQVGGREVVRVLRLDVSYRNLDGSVRFERRGEFEPEDGNFNDIINRAKADASSVQRTGIAADLERARVMMLRDAARTAEKSLLVAEARWVSHRFLKREPTEIEIAYFVSTRPRASFDEVAADFFERNESDRESLRSLITELSRGEIDRQTEESLLTVADKFGKGAVVRLLLGGATSDDVSDNPAEGDSQRPT